MLAGPAWAASASLLAPPTPPVLTLRAARALGPGWTITVRAVVLHGAETGNIRYVQDGKAGLNLYTHPTNILIFCDLQNGDSIQFRGQRKAYNGLLEMAPTLRFIRWPAAGGGTSAARASGPGYHGFCRGK